VKALVGHDLGGVAAGNREPAADRDLALAPHLLDGVGTHAFLLPPAAPSGDTVAYSKACRKAGLAAPSGLYRRLRMRLGFIGLGIVGRPMAKHLVDAGHEVTVWNRSRPGIETLVAGGAKEAADPAAVARASEVVFTMVADSPDVEQVALGAN